MVNSHPITLPHGELPPYRSFSRDKLSPHRSFSFFLFYYILLGRILQLPREKGHKRTARSYSKVPHLTHPPIHIRKTATAPGSPYSFRIVRGFFYVPQNYQHSRNCETGPPTYRPYPRRLESLTICRWYYKGSTFSSVILRP